MMAFITYCSKYTVSETVKGLSGPFSNSLWVDELIVDVISLL